MEKKEFEINFSRLKGKSEVVTAGFTNSDMCYFTGYSYANGYEKQFNEIWVWLWMDGKKVCLTELEHIKGLW